MATDIKLFTIATVKRVIQAVASNPSGPDSETIPAVLSRFRFLGSDVRVEALPAAAGFSGAKLWRITAGQGAFCLRRWPAEHPSRDRLEFIHAVLQYIARQGLEMVAVPLADQNGQSILEIGGAFWELTRWLPGEANFERLPSPHKLAAAMNTLARFHLAAATFGPTEILPSPAIADRSRQVEALRRGELQRVSAAIQESDWPTLLIQARQFLDLVPRVLDQLANRLLEASQLTAPLQPCIRDIWRDHMLFTGSRVTGLVDFGAMRIDNVACDVARLVGSLVADEPVQRTAGLAAYENLRPLSAAERKLVDAFDQSSVVLGGLNWLRWIYVEGRTFPERQRVENRFTTLLRRLRNLAVQDRGS